METNTKAAPARKITHGISFPNAGERDAAKARAKARRQSLSAYVCTLIEQDLRAQGCQPFANPANRSA